MALVAKEERLFCGVAALFLFAAVLLVTSPGGVSQSIPSPFSFICNSTCGGYGFMRTLCCRMVDEVCCQKSGTCPDDPMQGTLIPFCRPCRDDTDCFFTAKCCRVNGRDCCSRSNLSSSARTWSRLFPPRITTSTTTTKAPQAAADEEVTSIQEDEAPTTLQSL